MKKLIALLSLFCFTPAFADSLSVTTGEGYNGTHSKFVYMTYTQQLFKGTRFNVLESNYSFGELLPDNFLGPRQTLFGEAALGFKLRTHNVYLGCSQGVALLSDKPNRLNSYYQFPTTVSGGLYTDVASTGFVLKHFSNGSESAKNKGLDFYGMEFSFRF